jgi:putative nucleotidyltransferase with HDIG domain
VKKSLYAAIVLAGGLSTRMQQFKPLLPLGEETATDHVIDAFLSAGVDVSLVAGYRHDDIIAGIKKRDIDIIYNPDYEKGMFSSIQAGIRQLRPEYQGFFILPVDIPLVRPATIKRLMEAAVKNPDKIIYPTFAGKRGHPPLIPTTLIPTIMGWDKNGGLKAVLDSQERLALEVPVADSYILLDIDTPEDYKFLSERYRRYEVPTDEECHEILHTIFHMAPDRIKHCQKVADAAAEIGRAFGMMGSTPDIELIYVAALLHDIGKGQKQHDITGGKILQELGFDKVGDIVAVHSDLAGGNTKLSLEAKIVYIADKLIQGERQVSLEERYRSSRERFATTPKIEAAINKRLKVAQKVKMELEKTLGHRLEIVISGYT